MWVMSEDVILLYWAVTIWPIAVIRPLEVLREKALVWKASLLESDPWQID